jgi:phosphate transport system protein
MPREQLDRQIHHLQDEVLLLGSVVEQAVLDAVQALMRHDTDTARRLYYADKDINERRYAIENACFTTIATQQPVARDMRTLAALLEVSNELERIGDYAKGIAKICLMVNTDENSLFQIASDIPRMAEIGVDMLHRALGALVKEDIEAAREIPVMDDDVDQLYITVYRELIQAMIKNPEIIDQANYILWVAHNLERVADRVTNICERTIFIVSGELMEIKSKNDIDKPLLSLSKK